MSREKKQAFTLGGLVLVMIVVYGRALWPSAPPQTEPETHETEQKAASPTPAAADPIPDRSVERKAQRQRAATLLAVRDPFTSGSMSSEVSGLRLSGILGDARHPIAIINGRMAVVGDEIGGFRVVRISAESVSVTDGADTFELSLVSEAFPQAPDAEGSRPRGNGE
jgi:hypothetical protein